MSPEERAYAVCKAMEPAMVRMTGGAVATAHYDAGQELIAAAIRAAVQEEREACAAMVEKGAAALEQTHSLVNAEGMRHMAQILRDRQS